MSELRPSSVHGFPSSKGGCIPGRGQQLGVKRELGIEKIKAAHLSIRSPSVCSLCGDHSASSQSLMAEGPERSLVDNRGPGSCVQGPGLLFSSRGGSR